MTPGPILDHSSSQNGNHVNGKSAYPQPLQPSGTLDQFKFEDTTPTIGREFLGVNIVDDLLNAGEDANARLRDLAITISQRGVVFFRSQHNLTNDLQKTFIMKLGELTGRPSTSSLHIHPIHNSSSEFGDPDPEISVISSVGRKTFSHEQEAAQRARGGEKKYDAAQWHSDIQFEPCPADYTSLRLTQVPSSGGDTVWASGYELYERFSPAYRSFLESLTVTFRGEGFIKLAAAQPHRVKIHAGPRGSPENVGTGLEAVHPLVRTNPVTGWKSIFSVGPFPRFVNEVNHEESEELLGRFKAIVERNHDLQVRFKWKGENDIAIWDNRSVFHSATFDYEGLGERKGNRAVGIGERPYLDPGSVARSEGLAALGKKSGLSKRKNDDVGKGAGFGGVDVGKGEAVSA